MTRVELLARADARAREEHIHILAVKGRPGFYRTRSRSDSTTEYSLVHLDGHSACSCRGFEYRQSCKHHAALLNRLAREGKL